MARRNILDFFVPENVVSAALDDVFCEEIAAQSIVDVQSYRIAAHIAPNFCVDRLGSSSTASTCPDHRREQDSTAFVRFGWIGLLTVNSRPPVAR